MNRPTQPKTSTGAPPSSAPRAATDTLPGLGVGFVDTGRRAGIGPSNPVIEVAPDMLQWALNRASKSKEDIAQKEKSLPGLRRWIDGEEDPTYSELETFADWTNVSVGLLLLEEPWEETLPIADFRTMPRKSTREPSGNMMDTLYVCQLRQEWYREYMRSDTAKPLDFVGSLTTAVPVGEAADRIRQRIHWDPETLRPCQRWADKLNALRDQIENIGVLVMMSSCVEGRTSFPLDVTEFRGFAMCDDYAPLVFVNTNDAQSAQMFTLAHELAHVFLGESGISEAGLEPRSDATGPEVWCNAVAAELLVPMRLFQAQSPDTGTSSADLWQIARHFKVSTQVILRRMLDAGMISRARYDHLQAREAKAAEEHRRQSQGGGGVPYASHLKRLGTRFTSAVVASALEGRTLFREAYQLLEVRKSSSFDGLVAALRKVQANVSP